jgi:hypothetical protein
VLLLQDCECIDYDDKYTDDGKKKGGDDSKKGGDDIKNDLLNQWGDQLWGNQDCKQTGASPLYSRANSGCRHVALSVLVLHAPEHETQDLRGLHCHSWQLAPVRQV